jgi:hypothetical protein
MERMTRTQIMLEPRQHAFLACEAAAEGLSISALLRRIVDAHVQTVSPGREAPLWMLAGIIEDSEFSGRDHTEVLYGSRSGGRS